MKKVADFRSPDGHYTADACVVWCYDDRFYKLLKAFGKAQGFGNIDLVKVAGGAKALADGASPDRDFMLNQVATSVRLHGAKKVILMIHRDCGAYGGSSQFPDAETEKEHYLKDLRAAKEFLSGEVSVPVVACFADFDGLYEV